MAKIARVKKGALLKEIAPTVDQLVDVVNSITSGEVKITQTSDDKSTGKYIQSDANTVLQLNLQSGIPTPPSSATYVLGSVDGKVQWLATSDCPPPPP